MISITDASNLFQLLERLLHVITGRREITKKNFEEIVVPLFNELEGVVRRYHDALWELERDVRISTTHADIESAVAKAQAVRETLTTTRAKVYGLLNGIAGYEKKNGGEGWPPTLTNRKKRRLLWNVARHVDVLFQSPIEKTWTMLSYEFDEVFRSRKIRSVSKRREYLSEVLKTGIGSLDEAWRDACYSYAEALAYYKRL